MSTAETTGTDMVAVNPQTGELLDHLEQQPPATLCEALDAIHHRQADMKQWEAALEDELRRRLAVRRRKRDVMDGWEVANDTKRSREWDADELEGVLADLVARGTVQAGEITGIIQRVPKVSGTAAMKLRSRLTGDPQVAVDGTWEWKESRPKLTVTRSVELTAGSAEPDETLPPGQTGPSTPATAPDASPGRSRGAVPGGNEPQTPPTLSPAGSAPSGLFDDDDSDLFPAPAPAAQVYPPDVVPAPGKQPLRRYAGD